LGDYHSSRRNDAPCGIRVPIGQSAGGSGIRARGIPQQLRIILGIAKPLGAMALIVPGMAILKEWAYAGFTFAWICAFFAHYLAKEGPVAFGPLVLLVILAISYLTRPASRQCQARVAPIESSQKS
jgi:hypothetical protein